MLDQATVIRELKSNAGWVVVIGVLMVMFGLLSIAAPIVTGVAVAYLVGGVVLVAGMVQATHAFKAATWGGGGIAGFMIGLLAVVAGLVMIAHPVFNLKFLTLLLAAYFVVEGIATIVSAGQMPGAPGRGWVIFGGAMSLLLGALIWFQWPLSGRWAIGVLVGIRFLCTGWAMIALGTGVKAVQAGEPDAAAPTV